jgi:hypothetical protein
MRGRRRLRSRRTRQPFNQTASIITGKAVFRQHRTHPGPVAAKSAMARGSLVRNGSN